MDRVEEVFRRHRKKSYKGLSLKEFKDLVSQFKVEEKDPIKAYETFLDHLFLRYKRKKRKLKHHYHLIRKWYENKSKFGEYFLFLEGLPVYREKKSLSMTHTDFMIFLELFYPQLVDYYLSRFKGRWLKNKRKLKLVA